MRSEFFEPSAEVWRPKSGDERADFQFKVRKMDISDLQRADDAQGSNECCPEGVWFWLPDEKAPGDDLSGRPQSNLQVLYLQLLPALNKRPFHRSGDWRILEKDSFSTNCRFALDKWFGSIDLPLEASASEFCSIWPNASREYWSIRFGIQPATAISGTNSPSEPFPRSAIPAAITLRDVAFQQFSNFVDLNSALFIYIF